MSVRLKLALSYVGFLMLAATLLLAVVWVFLLRYVPEEIYTAGGPPVPDDMSRPRGIFIPNQSDLEAAFVPRAGAALVVLLVLGLVGGWLLAGRCAPRSRSPRPCSTSCATTRKGRGASWSSVSMPSTPGPSG